MAVNHTDHIRLILARFFLVLLSAIIVSGVLFIHKHTTRDGQIIIHIHPYDFTDADSTTDHHQTEGEIYHLDIIFSGNYIGSAPAEVQMPGVIPLRGEDQVYAESDDSRDCHALPDLRGPPVASGLSV